MLRIFMIIIITSLCSITQAQKRKFEKFVDKLDSSVVIRKDSIENRNNYELKWVKLSATYGGSPYCCGGKIIKAKKNIVYPDTNSYYTEGIPPTKLISTMIESFNGGQIIVESFKYFEPQPTSNEHYFYRTYYYQLKK